MDLEEKSAETREECQKSDPVADGTKNSLFLLSLAGSRGKES